MLKSLWPLQLLARSLGVAAATAVLLLMLASCATVVKGSADDGAPLKANQGLLVLQVESNADLSLAINDYAGEVSNSTIIAENLKGSKTMLRIPRGRSRWVVPMDAGDYSWSRVVSGATLAVLRPASLFRVAVGKLCYAGSLTLTSTGDKVYVSVRDEEADARAFVRDDYRRYSGAMPFTKFVTEFRADSAIKP